jgi:electron transport complex protein RnfA
MTTLGILAVFSGLTLNLVLQFGLGISKIIEPEGLKPEREWGKFSASFWAILFVSVLILWFFFTYLLSPPAFGFLESFLLFPAAVLVSMALELVFVYFFPDGKFTLHNSSKTKRGRFSPWKLAESTGISHAEIPLSSYNGLVLTSLFLTLRLAASPAEALVLSLGFSLGCLAAALILREISRRSSLEAVPGAFRGPPLMLISMGLLSLIFSSVSAILFRVLGVF